MSVVGAYYGIVIDSIFLGGTQQRINITGSRLKFIGRYIVVFIIWFLPIYVMRDISSKIFRGADDFSAEFLVRFAIPYFLWSLILFSISKYLMRKFKLTNDGNIT